MKNPVFYFLLFAGASAFGIEESNILAAGEWSAPVENHLHHVTIRGRLLFCEAPARGPGRATDVAVYLELEECSGAVGNAVLIRSGRGALRCDLRDRLGKSVPRSPGGFGGGVPSPCSVDLPPYSSFRFRASGFGAGRLQDGGLAVTLAAGERWEVHPASDSDYFLSGTFTIAAPADPSATKETLNTWNGTLSLPPVRLPIKRP